MLHRRRLYGPVNAWDPYYFVDRNVVSLFGCGMCHLYLQQGMIHALMAIGFLVALRTRVVHTIAETVDSAVLGNGKGKWSSTDRFGGWKAHEIFGGFGEERSRRRDETARGDEYRPL